jgi:hypothetical protein
MIRDSESLLTAGNMLVGHYYYPAQANELDR